MLDSFCYYLRPKMQCRVILQTEIIEKNNSIMYVGRSNFAYECISTKKQVLEVLSRYLQCKKVSYCRCAAFQNIDCIECYLRG